MRVIHLLAVAAVTSALSTPTAAQERREPSDRESAEIAKAPRGMTFSYRTDEPNRAALGIGTAATGTRRDTLGPMITSVMRGGPAERAGLEEGNRIAAINGVNLRANVADIEDYHTTGTLVRRLTRELAKVKPGDEVELRVYRDGRTQAMKVRTTSSDSLFRRATGSATATSVRRTRDDMDDRPALGISLGSSGSMRDTLGVLVMGVPDSTPAARAGLEEGNRIASINGVNLRVAREDAGDPYLGSAKAQRLQREIAQLRPGDEARLRVYANGQWRDVSVKVSRAGDLPRSRGMFFGGRGVDMAPMPPMPVFPRAPLPPMPPGGGVRVTEPIHFEFGPEIRRQFDQVRAQFERLGPELERLRPELDRIRMELPGILERIPIPAVEVKVDARPRVAPSTWTIAI